MSTAIAERGKAAEQAKGDWEKNKDRAWISAEHKRVQQDCAERDEATKDNPKAVKYVPKMNAFGFGGLLQRLTAIEDTATATGDLERAVADVATY